MGIKECSNGVLLKQEGFAMFPEDGQTLDLPVLLWKIVPVKVQPHLEHPPASGHSRTEASPSASLLQRELHASFLDSLISSWEPVYYQK